jgi:hypothetical protein
MITYRLKVIMTHVSWIMGWSLVGFYIILSERRFSFNWCTAARELSS